MLWVEAEVIFADITYQKPNISGLRYIENIPMMAKVVT